MISPVVTDRRLQIITLTGEPGCTSEGVGLLLRSGLLLLMSFDHPEGREKHL